MGVKKEPQLGDKMGILGLLLNELRTTWRSAWSHRKVAMDAKDSLGLGRPPTAATSLQVHSKEWPCPTCAFREALLSGLSQAHSPP